MTITIDFKPTFNITQAQVMQCECLMNNLNKCYSSSVGWLDFMGADEQTLNTIKAKAKQWQTIADTLVVVGVGGSNQATRAMVEALHLGTMEVVWAGNTLSAFEVNKIVRHLQSRRVVMHVIAKNFETLEPGVHYRVLRQFMESRYTEEELKDRIVITGTEHSLLHHIAQQKGHVFLPFPITIGGRYSAFTPVTLLTLATLGLNVDAFVQGAKDMKYSTEQGLNTLAFSYALWRNDVLNQGYAIEMLATFEPRLEALAKWWRQLFGESEGKEGKGIFPTYSIYSEDLHSIGQYVQEGKKHIMETFISLKNDSTSFVLPTHTSLEDGFHYLNGKDFFTINQIAEKATIQAHSQGGVPCCQITLNGLDEYHFGGLLFMFMLSCSISAQLLEVNPFNQDGVENYKKAMFENLGR